MSTAVESPSRLSLLARWLLLAWMCLVIWAAFLWVQPAMGFYGQASRIVIFHVPTAWVACLAFLVSCITSIQYLRRHRDIDDIRAASNALLGLLFAVLATVTGSIFAKIEWGRYWNWDPRQVTITILLLIYLAYFALRAAVVDPERRASLSAVYAILAFASVPFLVFVLPRMAPSTLHPDVIGETAKTGQGFDIRHTLTLLASLAGFTGLYAWLCRLDCSLERVRRAREEELL